MNRGSFEKKKKNIKKRGISKSSSESALILECDQKDLRNGTHSEVLFSQSLCLLTVFLEGVEDCG